MSGDNIEFEAAQLVRQYSLDAAGKLPGNTVARAITQAEEVHIASERKKEFEVQEWRKWLRFEEPEERVPPGIDYMRGYLIIYI